MTDSVPVSAETPLVSVRNLSFAHGRIPVLRDVSFDLHPGRHYIIAGQNGAGKSTLLDILANLKQPQAGAITVAGHNPTALPPGQLARILALAPQEFRLDFSFTVREIVAMGRRPYMDRWGRLDAEDIRVVAKTIAALRLDAMADQSVMTLSGGEKRRCIIARALAQATPALLLDEPDSGLDISHALAVMTLAKQLAADGGLVVTVSHDLNLSARYGDEFIFLKEGRLAAAGPVEAVFTDAILSHVYGAEARVRRDDFTGAPAVSFKSKS